MFNVIDSSLILIRRTWLSFSSFSQQTNWLIVSYWETFIFFSSLLCSTCLSSRWIIFFSSLTNNMIPHVEKYINRIRKTSNDYIDWILKADERLLTTHMHTDKELMIFGLTQKEKKNEKRCWVKDFRLCIYLVSVNQSDKLHQLTNK